MDAQGFIIEISDIQLHRKVIEIQYSQSNDVLAPSMSAAPPVLAQYLESRSCMWGSLLALSCLVSAICKEKKKCYFSCPSNPWSMLDQPAGNPSNLVEDSTFAYSTTALQYYSRSILSKKVTGMTSLEDFLLTFSLSCCLLSVTLLAYDHNTLCIEGTQAAKEDRLWFNL